LIYLNIKYFIIIVSHYVTGKILTIININYRYNWLMK